MGRTRESRLTWDSGKKNSDSELAKESEREREREREQE